MTVVSPWTAPATIHAWVLYVQSIQYSLQKQFAHAKRRYNTLMRNLTNNRLCTEQRNEIIASHVIWSTHPTKLFHTLSFKSTYIHFKMVRMPDILSLNIISSQDIITKVQLTDYMLHSLRDFTNAVIELTLSTPEMQTSMHEHHLSSEFRQPKY